MIERKWWIVKVGNYYKSMDEDEYKKYLKEKEKENEQEKSDIRDRRKNYKRA